MIRRLLVAVMALAPLVAAAQEKTPEAAAAGPALPDHPEVQKAREAYNAGSYHLAARRFLAAAQRWPEESAIYLALARARVYAGEHSGAVQAYRLYLEMVPEAPDREKIQAELELAERKVEGGVPRTVPGARTLEAASVRAQAGRFAGEDGALGALAAAVEEGYVGPELARARRAVVDELARQSEDAIDRWWRAEARTDPETLARLHAGWKTLRDAVPGAAPTPAQSRLTGAVEGLSLLAADNVVGALEALSTVAPGDHRLRYAQAVALIRARRLPEAAALLGALSRQLEDPRIQALRGLVLAELGDKEAVEALKLALD